MFASVPLRVRDLFADDSDVYSNVKAFFFELLPLREVSFLRDLHNYPFDVVFVRDFKQQRQMEVFLMCLVQLYAFINPTAKPRYKKDPLNERAFVVLGGEVLALVLFVPSI